MDYIMPNMSGPEATAKLRQLGYRGMVIGVTGNALPEDIAKFKRSGADHVLIKPIHTEELLAHITK
jgi:CheY-like chemotaxis protein